jgi:post-segregation antitoxin (ccd killing protein)
MKSNSKNVTIIIPRDLYLMYKSLPFKLNISQICQKAIMEEITLMREFYQFKNERFKHEKGKE